MKRVMWFCLVAVAVFFIGGNIQADEAKKEKPVKYEVTIIITYNEVSGDEAVALVKEVTAKHEKACDVSVKVKKVTGYGNLTISSGSDIVTTPGTIIYSPYTTTK